MVSRRLVSLIRLVSYRDLFISWFCVAIKVLAILLLIISWLAILDREFRTVSLVDILELLTIVIIGRVGFFSVLFSAFSLVVSSGFAYVTLANLSIS